MSKARPAHAKGFKGRAKNIPEADLFMLPYQDRWIKDPAIMKLMEKSRRVGISYGSSYEDVRYHAQAENIFRTKGAAKPDKKTAALTPDTLDLLPGVRRLLQLHMRFG